LWDVVKPERGSPMSLIPSDLVLDLKNDLTVIDDNRIAHQGKLSRRIQHFPCPKIEPRLMNWAGN